MNRRDFGRLFFLILILLLWQGCAAHRKISYPLKDIASIQNDYLSQFSLDIQTFEDIRQSVEDNQILFLENRQCKIDNKTYCINSEKHYEKDTVNIQISNMIAEHMKKRGSFKEVAFNDKTNADYYVTGKIKRFYGEREYSSGAASTRAISSQFGCIGGAIGGASIAKMRVPGVVEIEFTDVKIFRNDGTELQSIDDIYEKVEEEMHVDGYCWTIYPIVNAQLKVAVGRLSEKIEAAILESREQNKIEQNEESQGAEL